MRVSGLTFSHIAFSHIALPHVALHFPSHMLVPVLHCCLVLGLGLGLVLCLCLCLCLGLRLRLLLPQTFRHTAIPWVAHKVTRRLIRRRALSIQ